MEPKEIIKKVQKNGKDIATKGSEVVEKAYQSTVELISQAKDRKSVV